MKKIYTIIIAIVLFASTPSVQAANILLVPGHEPGYGGTVYKERYERDIVLMITDELEKLLEKDKGAMVSRTRDEEGWTDTFTDYFVEEWENIASWIEKHKQENIARLESGEITEPQDVVQHNNAAPEVARRLYGINKWSNENDIDLVLHLHINDAVRADTDRTGPYKGFAIYIPEKQLSNAKESKEVALDLRQSLKKKLKTSTMPQEKKGIVEGQDLIAIGAFDTRDAASVLIEYGYIYESQFKSRKTQRAFAKKAAKATYDGLRDFLREK